MERAFDAEAVAKFRATCDKILDQKLPYVLFFVEADVYAAAVSDQELMPVAAKKLLGMYMNADLPEDETRPDNDRPN